MGRTPSYDICPDPVYGYVGFVGDLFSWGLAGGSAVHFVKGFRASPSGARLAGAVNAVRQNAPSVAGRFGAYCIFLSVIEIAASLALRRDDYWTGGTAAAATGGLHGMLRRGGGPGAAARCALLAAPGVVGLDLALDWGLSVNASRLYPQNRQMNVRLPRPWVDASHRRPPQWLKISPSGTREKELRPSWVTKDFGMEQR
ncbi:hypothetical protein BDA96_02G346300 [Sorghum bicolor]|uniref:Uncharacterized protein n=2 Tax=Sorghum bicolor TaxID=4558 RepID=A0A921RS90_SORBI|nr:mitochondrial import inner membrane translocase subunit TIM17-2 [Sorghum bicolor]EER99484.2 hypothetical protein SORBI_3002G330200 [Sorghum bicolor]KAG0545267.1 hypothetical protein BDA96_02G346300 [Sorghum bicolor]|eukprot:XP_002462977.2 mitochondrial import inner membrane translocase subunit TIM17-2 [Sorghum bicolor]